MGGPRCSRRPIAPSRSWWNCRTQYSMDSIGMSHNGKPNLQSKRCEHNISAYSSALQEAAKEMDVINIEHFWFFQKWNAGYRDTGYRCGFPQMMPTNLPKKQLQAHTCYRFRVENLLGQATMCPYLWYVLKSTGFSRRYTRHFPSIASRNAKLLLAIWYHSIEITLWKMYKGSIAE